ncbi:hypothetical protein Sphch_1845 [Sphingobium chlorophenolicum L-1]|uniref:Uncharacterized protein n=1 Tax=Sphingobium chlorophenolicum L-1 TaxID=690566 RepID=F6ETN4_SPHCR|nr:hypothetical protein Sphch_1845 [Sphingobium chlorophenolicum L-1]
MPAAHGARAEACSIAEHQHRGADLLGGSLADRDSRFAPLEAVTF